VCPGFYRCKSSSVCVHLDHLCDGWPQCPLHDDELLCGFQPCPDKCVCQGLAFSCRGFFSVEKYSSLRYLDVDKVPPFNISYMSSYTHLVHLRLTHCNISFYTAGIELPNLQHLDLSSNRLSTCSIQILQGLPNMKILKLFNNPITKLIGGNLSTNPSSVLQTLDISLTMLTHFDSKGFHFLQGIENLNLSHSNIHTIGNGGFKFFPNLQTLDLRGCPLREFPLDLYQGLKSLALVYSPDYRLCCKCVLPVRATKVVCVSPTSVLSSCDNLLGSVSYHAVYIVLSMAGLVGNVACIVTRCWRYKRQVKV
jgi:Leucine-rich repeat (LRR) protein